MTKEEKTEKLKKIRDEVWNLEGSPLYTYRKKNNYYPVIGEGNHSAKIMFIGEAPGKNEAETGRPFCGAAGKILDQLLENTSLKREEVYITNVVKDRPPQNRDPTLEEIETYFPYLIRQINIIKPRKIATLGRFSMKHIMEHFGLGEKIQPISRIHGEVFSVQSSYGNIKIIPLYHPAVAVYRPDKLPVLKKDFKRVKSP